MQKFRCHCFPYFNISINCRLYGIGLAEQTSLVVIVHLPRRKKPIKRSRHRWTCNGAVGNSKVFESCWLSYSKGKSCDISPVNHNNLKLLFTIYYSISHRFHRVSSRHHWLNRPAHAGAQQGLELNTIAWHTITLTKNEPPASLIRRMWLVAQRPDPAPSFVFFKYFYRILLRAYIFFWIICLIWKETAFFAR